MADEKKTVSESKKKIHDLEKLIKDWVDEKAISVKTSCDWVDLNYQKPKAQVALMRTYDKVEKFEIKKVKTRYANSPKLIEDEKKKIGGRSEECKNPTDKETEFKLNVGSKATTHRGYSLTCGLTLSTTFTASASILEIEAGIELSLEATMEKSVDNEESIDREVSVQVKPQHNSSYTINLYSIPTVDEFTVELELKGKVPVSFTDKVTHEKCSNFKIDRKGHKLQFISIVEILEDLKFQKKLPEDFHVENGKAFCTLKGEYRTQEYKTEIVIEKQTPLKGKNDLHSQIIPSSHKPAVELDANEKSNQQKENPATGVNTVQKNRTDLKATGFNNAIFEGTVTHQGVEQRLFDIETDTWDKGDKDTVDKAIKKVGNIETNMFNNATFHEKVEMGAVSNIGVKVKRIKGAQNSEPASSSTPSSQATLTSMQGIHAIKLTPSDIKLIMEIDKLIREVNSRPEYKDNFGIQYYRDEIKNIADTHKQSKTAFTEEETKTIKEHIAGIQKEKDEVDKEKAQGLTT